MNIFKKEPAVIIGVVITALTYIQQGIATSAGQALTWKTLLPLVATVLTRFFVTPTVVEKKAVDGNG